MKKYIDFLFWKRNWFRYSFVYFPVWMVPVLILKGDDSDLLMVFLNLYFFIMALSLYDNKNVGGPDNPFGEINLEKNSSKKITAKKAAY